MPNPLALSDLLKNLKLLAILENLTRVTDNPVSVLDLEKNLILGQTFGTSSQEYPIMRQQEIIGWVKGQQAAQVLAQLLTHLANQQILILFDDLTQIPNRRYFNLYIHQEWLRSQRENRPLSLLLCDLDDFKFYNDYYGHQKGDLCLQQVAQVLSSSLQRPADLLFRYGGEEFAIVLPNTDLDGAQAVAQHLISSVLQSKISHPASSVEAYLTISLGVTTVIPGKGLRIEDLIKAADIALYQAKETGRNRYCTQEILSPNSSSPD